MTFIHCYLIEGVVLETFCRSLGVASTSGAFAAAGHRCFGRIFVFFVSFFLLCAFLMSS
jgi:hypothetical protein